MSDTDMWTVVAKEKWKITSSWREKKLLCVFIRPREEKTSMVAMDPEPRGSFKLNVTAQWFLHLRKTIRNLKFFYKLLSTYFKNITLVFFKISLVSTRLKKDKCSDFLLIVLLLVHHVPQWWLTAAFTRGRCFPAHLTRRCTLESQSDKRNQRGASFYFYVFIIRFQHIMSRIVLESMSGEGFFFPAFPRPCDWLQGEKEHNEVNFMRRVITKLSPPANLVSISFQQVFLSLGDRLPARVDITDKCRKSQAKRKKLYCLGLKQRWWRKNRRRTPASPPISGWVFGTVGINSADAFISANHVETTCR